MLSFCCNHLRITNAVDASICLIPGHNEILHAIIYWALTGAVSDMMSRAVCDFSMSPLFQTIYGLAASSAVTE